MTQQPTKKYVHKTLKDKIKSVVKDEKDVGRIMDYFYWEASKLTAPSKLDKSLKNRVIKFIDDLKK
jgi:hypothetical protein